MPGLVNIAAPKTAAAVADGGGTETVIITSNGVNPDNQETQVTVWGHLEITTAAAGTTAIVIKVRRGTTATATQVGTTQTITATTSTKYSIPFMVTDTPGVGGPDVYSVTVTETGAAGNLGTVDTAVIAALVATIT